MEEEEQKPTSLSACVERGDGGKGIVAEAKNAGGNGGYVAAEGKEGEEEAAAAAAAVGQKPASSSRGACDAKWEEAAAGSDGGGCGGGGDAGDGAGADVGSPAPPSFQTSSTEAKRRDADNDAADVAAISNGDWPHVNGALNMTVSGSKTEDAYEPVSVATAAEGSPVSETGNRAAASATPSSTSEEDGETPMNLSPESAEKTEDGDEAMSVCPPPAHSTDTKIGDASEREKEITGSANTATFGMCAKMRLKKQRIAAFAAQEEQMKTAAAAAAASNVSEMQVAKETDPPNSIAATSARGRSPVFGTTNSAPFRDNQASALHRLAEAAQRKQEEEMMEVESSAVPASRLQAVPGSPTATISANTLINGRRHFHQRLLPSTSGAHSKGLITNAQLAPNTEYELSSPPTASPVTARQYGGGGGGGGGKVAAAPSPDSAIHSAYYSPSQSPVQSRHQVQSGLSSPFSLRTTPSLSRNNSDASQYGGSQYSSSTTSPLSPTQFSPSHSPVQTRHNLLPSSPLPSSLQRVQQQQVPPSAAAAAIILREENNRRSSPLGDINEGAVEPNGNPPMGYDAAGIITCSGAAQAQAAGISRQQLINSPCPVCGDKISGFHYGIFSCESCKGFFKRTVQNKKNYVCLRGAQCPISIASRKKCPACRFDKCLKTGMKLEAIREDRTRGGRSTYQCSYTLPANLCPPAASASASSASPPHSAGTPISLSSSMPLGLPSVPLPPPPPPPPPLARHLLQLQPPPNSASVSVSGDELMIVETTTPPAAAPGRLLVDESHVSDESDEHLPLQLSKEPVPELLQEIMSVEHLWFSSKPQFSQGLDSSSRVAHREPETSEEDMVKTLTVMADKRLYKLVKWCKSLPLFKNILIDDQIALLINAWCELLVFSCCYRSVSSPPGVVRVSNEKSLTLHTARQYGIEKCVEKMLNFTDQLRRLRVDYYEYVSMKVIVLLTSDATGLKEPEHVRDSQEKVVQSLQQYTTAKYKSMPSKFGELLLRIPELQRVCQVGKEMLCPRQQSAGEPTGFNLLMELLRGDH